MPEIIVTGTSSHTMRLSEDTVTAHIALRGLPSTTLTIRRASEGVIHVEIEDRKKIDNRINTAYNEFMMRLFGRVPKVSQDEQVDRDKYTQEMLFIQNKYGLEQGDPDFLEWMLTLVGRSPALTSEGKIVYDTGRPAGIIPAMGEAPFGEAERQ